MDIPNFIVVFEKQQEYFLLWPTNQPYGDSNTALQTAFVGSKIRVFLGQETQVYACAHRLNIHHRQNNARTGNKDVKNRQESGREKGNKLFT